MSKNSSQRHVDFIANLMPLYQHDEVESLRCARSLKDGTLLVPIHGIEDGLDEDWIHVWWHGDAVRKSEVRAFEIASIAIVDYVNFHCLGKSQEHVFGMLLDLARHYHVKTGGKIYMPYDDMDDTVFLKVVEVAKRIGPKVAYDILKKAAGI